MERFSSGVPNIWDWGDHFRGVQFYPILLKVTGERSNKCRENDYYLVPYLIKYFSLIFFSVQLFASGGGGCCDCGDPEAWTSGVYCELHMPNEQSEDDVDPVERLQPELATRAHVFFSALLWYCMDVLCWTERKSLPPELMQGKTAEW